MTEQRNTPEGNGAATSSSGPLPLLVRCACDSWARQVNTATVRYQRHTHPPGCPNRAADDELWDIMARLLYGMDCWASDEDGAIHPEAWQAYRDARALVGVPVSETAT